jgi:hypothetical protein
MMPSVKILESRKEVLEALRQMHKVWRERAQMTFEEWEYSSELVGMMDNIAWYTTSQIPLSPHYLKNMNVFVM